MHIKFRKSGILVKLISVFMLLSFILNGFLIDRHVVVYASDYLRSRAAKQDGGDITGLFNELNAPKAMFTSGELALLDAVKKAQDALPGDVNEQNLNFVVQTNEQGNLLYPLSPEAKIIIGHIRDDRAAYFARGLQKRGFNNLMGYIKFAEDFKGKYVLPEEVIAEVPNTFFERLSNKGYTVVKVSEDEKKTHAGDNANGRRKSPFKGERRIVIEMQKSKKAYVDTPQMRMKECSDAVLIELDGEVDFILVNLLSSDMLKHTGSFEASVEGNQITDSQLGRIKEKIDAIKQNIVKLVESEITNIKTGNELKELLNDNYDKFLEKLKTVNGNIYNNVINLEMRVPMLVVTADHGASEDGLKANQKESDTFHTANPVPYIIYDPLRKKKIPLKSDKTIVSNAATLLHLLGEDIPSTYEESLLPDDYKGSKRRIVFCVLDGWGINPDRNYPYDAIRLANVPNYNWLVENASFTQLKAHGEVIGLRSQLSYEEGPHHLKGLQAGQTDIGHLHLFSGRQIKQPLWLMDKLIKGNINEGVFDESKPEVKMLIDELNEVKEKNLQLVYIAVASEGGVHSSLYHMYALMRLAKKLGLKKNQLVIIPAADGRDVPSRTADLYLRDIFTKIREIGIGVVSGVFGRDMLVRKEGMEQITNRIIDVFSGSDLVKPDVIRAGLNEKFDGEEKKIDSLANEENFFASHSRVYNLTGGQTAVPDYLLKIEEYLKLRRQVTSNKLALVVHSSILKNGGALDMLKAAIKLEPYDIVLNIFGDGADKLKNVLFRDNDNVYAASTFNSLPLEGVVRLEDIVVLIPAGEKIDLNVKQIVFTEKTLSTVAVAKALEALVGTPQAREAFKKFYAEVKNQEIITSASYEATKEKMFTELKEGMFSLPQIEPEHKILEIINKESEALSKFVDSYI